MGKPMGGIDLQDRGRSHVCSGQRMAIDFATAKVGAIGWQVGQAHIANALGLCFLNGLRDYLALRRTRTT